MAESKFKTGDLVIHRSDLGPKMTVTLITSDDVTCTYWNQKESVFALAYLKQQELIMVDAYSEA
jgi:uncharacterized protein YodC (DUF2158 family)